jgi:hypothetical protein
VCRHSGAQGGPTLGSDAGLSGSGAAQPAAGSGGQAKPGAAGVGGRLSNPAAGSGAGHAALQAGSAGTTPPVIVPDPPFMPHEFIALPSGRSLVAGGVRAQSSNFTLLRSVGQSPAAGYPLRTSPQYRLVGGALGVVQNEK